MSFSQYEIASGALALFFALISIISTVVTLLLIREMKRWNAYMLLIFNLTFCQFFYDLALFFLPFYSNATCVYILIFLTTFSGTAVTLWTNVISFILYSIVKNLHSFDVYGHFRCFFLSIMIPSLTLACLDLAFFDNPEIYNILKNLYYWLRIASIVFNIAVHGLISYKLSRMGFAEGSVKQDPVRILASRLKYYPIVQIVSRAGAAWYEAAYGFDTNTFDNTMGTTQQASLYFYAICVPSAGLGYFLVFLLVQPRAYTILKSKLRLYFPCCFTGGASAGNVLSDSAAAGHDRTLSGTDGSSVGGGTHTSGGGDNHHSSRVESTLSSSLYLIAPKHSTDVSVTSGPLSSMDSTAILNLLDDLDEDELAERIDMRYNPGAIVVHSQLHGPGGVNSGNSGNSASGGNNDSTLHSNTLANSGIGVGTVDALHQAARLSTLSRLSEATRASMKDLEKNEFPL